MLSSFYEIVWPFLRIASYLKFDKNIGRYRFDWVNKNNQFSHLNYLILLLQVVFWLDHCIVSLIEPKYDMWLSLDLHILYQKWFYCPLNFSLPKILFLNAYLRRLRAGKLLYPLSVKDYLIILDKNQAENW